MRYTHGRGSAEVVRKWKICIGALLPSTLAYFLIFSPPEVCWAGLACLSNPCVYGICVDNVNNTFLCYCIDGYTGFLCQTNWDECWSSPCLNGGSCFDGVAHYNCTCPQGYQGELCEQNIDECESNPCHNNGTCVDGPNGYTCICLSGYLGNFCETDISVCNDTHESRCLNGGFCIEGPGFTFNCACSLGWEGQFCEKAIDECTSSPCFNGAICLDLQANYTCACPFGFSGRNCEVELEMCGDTSPCQNGAVCLVEDWLRVCYCVPDFHGDRCQYQYNECLLGPGCLNGGTCIDGVDGYDCSCPPGWSGNFCECLVVSENDMDCSYPLPPAITSLTVPPTPAQTVPIWNEIKVPKTTLSTTQKISPRVTTSNNFYSLLTECIPLWPQYTLKYPSTLKNVVVPKKTTRIPYNWLTQKFLPTRRTEDTKTTEGVTSLITKKSTVLHTNATTQTALPTALINKIQPTSTITTKAQTKSIIKTTIQTSPTETTATTTQTTPMSTTSTPTQSTPITKPTTQSAPTITTMTPTPSTITTTNKTRTLIISTNIKTTQALTTTTKIQLRPSTTNITPLITAATTPATLTIDGSSIMSPQTAMTTAKTTMQISSVTTTTSETTPETTTMPMPKKTTKQIIPTTTTPTQAATKTKTKTVTEKETISKSTFITAADTTSKTPKMFPSLSPPLQTAVLNTTTACVNSTQMPTLASTSASWNCKNNLCMNGGTCLNTTNGPRCICRSKWEGPFCNDIVDIRLVGLSGKSYISHKLINTHSIKIDVTARTISPEGLILYSHLGPDIFMTLYLEDGMLKFKFSCGFQTMLLSEMQFHINNGFDLIVSVTLDFLPPTNNPFHCAAAVRINNTLAMSGEQLARGSHADSGSAGVYIGGVPSRFVDRKEAPVLKGFVGCMHNLVIDRKPKGIFRDSFDNNDVTECNSLACLSNPCRSGSSCIEHKNSWTCLCPSGFLGQTCDISICKNNPCKFGGTCAPFPGSGFICLCPLGKQGLFCENDAETGYPLFASSISGFSSFAAYKLPTEIYQDMLLTFKFLPHDMEQISLMVFLGQDGYHRATSDHLAVSFIKGHVVLTWNLGSGPRRIFTSHPVPNTGRFFHTVQIGRIGQRAWLAVDNQSNVTGRSPGKLTQLNTRSIVYLGGHESRNFSLLPHDLPLHTGFSGCLFDVELRTGQMLIKIEKTPPAFSRGVGQCGRSLCNEHSCKNGGGCIHHGATFTCLCPDGWFGPTCAMKYNPCDSTRHNCSEGSTCIPLTQGFSCDCSVGKTGKFCEINEELSDVKLKGVRSYIALAIEGLHHFQSCIDFEIRPLSLHGLILYSGKQEGNTFWSLSLQDGILELRISPGVHRKQGAILVLRCRRLLSLGKWHRIRAGRYGRRLFLWVEGTVSTGVLLPGEHLPPIGTIVYIGGVPDLSKIPVGVSGKVLTSFQGCLRKFTSQWQGIPLTKNNILEGRNVEDCDGSVCGGDVCENGGTCHVNANNEPFCTCLKQYLGKRCEYRLSCKQIKCKNGGRCAQEKALIPRCHCPNGWSGPFCESGVSIKAPQFVGNSYLLVNRTDTTGIKRRDTQIKVYVNFINLNFSTVEPHGMMLWSSREKNSEFIGIGTENGKIKFVWALDGHNVTIVTSEEQIADGAWHDLAISFESPNITIWMDRQTIFNTNDSQPGYPLATDGRFFLGGFPESASVATKTFGHFSSGFEGCLQKLSLGDELEIVNFSSFTGENIRICDPFGLYKNY